jgi:DNA-3-methyladenine glycosylase I
MVRYHDREWGVPSADDRHLFEMLTLEGAQAGLSWRTILAKRERYVEVFAGFDPAKVARFTPARRERLLRDPGIVRNRAKVEATVDNARAFLALAREEGSFARWLWAFVDYVPLQGRWRNTGAVPAETELSRRISRELKQRGFRFVGPTIVQSFLQAAGVVNDHELACFRHAALAKRRAPASAKRAQRGLAERIHDS